MFGLLLQAVLLFQINSIAKSEELQSVAAVRVEILLEGGPSPPFAGAAVTARSAPRD